ncbi:N-acylneuraminate cytidylyltransferase-like [Ylistrum balloti]|uniref:N-acylneuraminate cytidylyltransferase-like n=1 Tax=Ylistrum balloti TaxID=509963 RepID=UPI002905F527|nr:N-acylneuraminate cytidylyltransferase-like [Ylistrum balloti]
MNVAIIPARKGSKLLKDKNILPFMGKPLMAHTIEAALHSKLFEKVLVSTDSEKYAGIARQYGADVPFLRSEALAGDAVPSSEVSKEVLRLLAKNNEHYTYFAVLQATSPLRGAEDIQNSHKLLIEKNAEIVVSVCPSPIPQPWINVLAENCSMHNFIPKQYRNKSRQSLPQYYKMHGAIFWGRVDTYHRQTNPFTKRCYAYIMETECSIDIDSDIDYELAKILYAKQRRASTG